MDRVDYQSTIIQDLLNDYEDKKLNLNPWYQRRSVWTNTQKSYLINTLFERKPIPALYIRHTIDIDKQRSIKELVDGQQRSRSIIEYCENKFTARTKDSGPRVAFKNLSAAEREHFLLTPLPVGYLLGAFDEDVIDIFGRMNSISKTLNTQEKRNAKFSGEFKQFCLKFSSKNLTFWRGASVFTANQIARMTEVQFVSDIVVNLLNGLSDFRPADLDAAYRENDDDFPRMDEIEERLWRIFNIFYEMNAQAFKDTIFRRAPLLFSLIIVLDKIANIDALNLEECLYLMDAEFQDQDNTRAGVVQFRESLSASTQRLSSRIIREKFLKKIL